jgi:hypothetical protein
VFSEVKRFSKMCPLDLATRRSFSDPDKILDLSSQKSYCSGLNRYLVMRKWMRVVFRQLF